MATEEEIRAEIEELGRLTPEQEDILYNITLKQDELGRQTTNMLLEKVVDSPVYQPMIDREYLTYDVFNHGSKHEVACLYVTLKGVRYCIMHADEHRSREREGASAVRSPLRLRWQSAMAERRLSLAAFLLARAFVHGAWRSAEPGCG